jgi:hypothetical protein
MKKISIFCVCMLLAWMTGYAQKRVSGGLGHIQLGYKNMGLGQLNDRLTENGYPGINQHFSQIGGSAMIIYNNVILGGEGYTFRGGQVEDDAFTLDANGGAGLINFGYVSYAHSKFLLYPLVGVGVGHFRLGFREQANGTSFDNVLDNPQRGADLRLTNVLIDLSLNADYRLFGRRGAGLTGGLSVGYTLAPNSQNWTFDTNQAIENGPAVNLSGFFARLRIGLGGWFVRSDF